MKKRTAVFACFGACLSLSFFAGAQTITVDLSHPTNHFVPKETLGAGVDRIAVEAIDKDLQQPTSGKLWPRDGSRLLIGRTRNWRSKRGTGIRKAPGASSEQWQRIFHRLGDSHGNDSLFVWV